MAGGRTLMGVEQLRCFTAGANGAIVGNYLTTAGNTLAEAPADVRRSGFRHCRQGEPKAMTETLAARSTADLLDFDRRHLWHPYTSIDQPLSVYPVASAKGVRLRLMDGRELIDGMASWWSVIHGYSHPRLNEAIRDQAEQLAHVMFGGLTHEPAVELGRRLVQLTPAGLDRVFSATPGRWPWKWR